MRSPREGVRMSATMRSAWILAKRLARWLWRLHLGLLAVYLASLLAGLPFGWPFDAWTNAGAVEHVAAWRAPADGKRRVVVLVHGMFRSSWALGRLERTLRAHGYEVLNFDYPSTAARLEQHAERLGAAVESLHARGAVAELSLVGHSMGGLVIQQYLRQATARPVAHCVYIAVPHRGAMLADLRKHWFLFRWVMGTAAALQLSPGDAFHQQAIPRPGKTGVLVGNVGPGNPSIPGDDDRTVGVAEASLPGADATLVVPFGHSRIVFHPDTALQVLRFLRLGSFASPEVLQREARPARI